MNRGKSQQIQTLVVSSAGLIVSILVYIYGLMWRVDYYSLPHDFVFTALWATLLVVSMYSYYAAEETDNEKQQKNNRLLIEVLLFAYVVISIVTWILDGKYMIQLPLITASSRFAPIVTVLYIISLIYIVRHRSTDIVLVCLPFTVMLLFISPFDRGLCSVYSSLRTCQEILIPALICSLASESLDENIVKKRKKFTFDDLMIDHWLLISEDDDNECYTEKESIEKPDVSQSEYAVCSVIWIALLIMIFYLYSTEDALFLAQFKVMLSLTAVLPFIVLLMQDVRNYCTMVLTAFSTLFVYNAFTSFYSGVEYIIAIGIISAPVISIIYSMHMMKAENVIRIKCIAVMMILVDWIMLESFIISASFYSLD